MPAQITNIQFLRAFPSKFGDATGQQYAFAYTFADGSEGEASHKSNPPPFKVGDWAEVTLKGDRNGVPQLKLQRPQTGVAAPSAPVARPAAPQARSVPQNASSVASRDAKAFRTAMRRMSLFWMHCASFADEISNRLPNQLSDDQWQSLVASLFIEGNKQGLSSYVMPSISPTDDAPAAPVQQTPPPVQRAVSGPDGSAFPPNTDDDDVGF